MNNILKTISLILGVLFANLTFASTLDQFPIYDVNILGTLLPLWSDAYAVNNNGWVVGDAAHWDNNYLKLWAFRWKDGFLTNLGLLDSNNYWNSVAHGINDYGQIVGWNEGNNVTAFLWGPEIPGPNDIILLQDLPELPSCTSSWAYDINNHEQIVGYSYGSIVHDHAVLWQNGQIIDLGRGTAYAINDNGQIVGSANQHATLFDPNGTGNNIDLGTLEGSSSVAYDINNRGQVVGTSGSRGFLWENGVMMDLGTFGFQSIYVQGINDKEQIVGSVTTNQGERAFLWNSATGSTDIYDPNNGFILLDQLYDANLPSSEFESLDWAFDINNNGQITGRGWSKRHYDQAFLMTPRSIVKYTLTIETEPNTITTVTPAAGQHEFSENWIIPISAQSSTDCPDVYYFTEWQGSVIVPNSANTHVLIDGDKTVRAVFDMGDRVCGDMCHPILQGDMNRDCYINMEDFMLFVESWLACTHPNCD